MPTKKIASPSGKSKLRCKHPEHKAAMHIVREPGLYEHTCPACGSSYTFHVEERPTWKEKIERDTDMYLRIPGVVDRVNERGSKT